MSSVVDQIRRNSIGQRKVYLFPRAVYQLQIKEKIRNLASMERAELRVLRPRNTPVEEISEDRLPMRLDARASP